MYVYRFIEIGMVYIHKLAGVLSIHSEYRTRIVIIFRVYRAEVSYGFTKINL